MYLCLVNQKPMNTRYILSILFLLSTLSQMLSASDGLAVYKGVVIDNETGEALSFASVQLSGTSTYSALTDAEGQFYFAAIPVGDYRLRLSYVGYEPIDRETTIKTDNSVVLKMNPANTLLREVVVTAHESRGIVSA